MIGESKQESAKLKGSKKCLIMELVLLESRLLLIYGRECSRIRVLFREEERMIQNNREMPVGGGARGGAQLCKSSELRRRERERQGAGQDHWMRLN